MYAKYGADWSITVDFHLSHIYIYILYNPNNNICISQLYILTINLPINLPIIFVLFQLKY